MCHSGAATGAGSLGSGGGLDMLSDKAAVRVTGECVRVFVCLLQMLGSRVALIFCNEGFFFLLPLSF